MRRLQGMNAALSFALVGLFLAAGCLGGRGGEGCGPGSSCADPSTGPTAGSSGGPSSTTGLSSVPLPGSLNATIEWESCSGTTGLGELPEDQVRPHVPEEFGLVGFAFNTVHAGYYSFDCPRVAAADKVYENVRMVYTAVTVQPRNLSWDIPGGDAYLLQIMVDDPELVQQLRGWGLPFELAQISVTETSTPVNVTHQEWTATSAGATFTFSIIFQGDPGTRGDFTGSYWLGNGPFVRVDNQVAFIYDGTQALEDGLFRSEGPSRTHDAFGDALPVIMSPYLERSETWPIDAARIYQSEP